MQEVGIAGTRGLIWEAKGEAVPGFSALLICKTLNFVTCFSLLLWDRFSSSLSQVQNHEWKSSCKELIRTNVLSTCTGYSKDHTSFSAIRDLRSNLPSILLGGSTCHSLTTGWWCTWTEASHQNEFEMKISKLRD